jgi:hypothetical protein
METDMEALLTFATIVIITTVFAALSVVFGVDSRDDLVTDRFRAGLV